MFNRNINENALRVVNNVERHGLGLINVNAQLPANSKLPLESPSEPALPILKSYAARLTTNDNTKVNENENPPQFHQLQTAKQPLSQEDDIALAKAKIKKVAAAFVSNKETTRQPVPQQPLVAPVQQQQQQPVVETAPALGPSLSRIPRLSLKPLPFFNSTNTASQQQHNLHQSLRNKIPSAGLTAAGPILKVTPETEPECASPDVEEQIEDIDKSQKGDAAILQVSDLAKDIYDYMYQLEDKQAIRPDYLSGQKILTPKVRQRLINWCIDVHSKLGLIPETMYMSIAVMDRYFDRVTITQQKQVQLVAVGAILIASKYEEIYPPEISDLMHLTENCYTKREIIRIECEILERLQFDLGKPIPLAFLRRFSKAAHCDLKMHSIAKYLMELSLTEYECAHWKPSYLAAAALFVSLHLVNNASSGSIERVTSATRRPTAGSLGDRWTRSLVHYTRYAKKELIEPAGRLCKILKRSRASPQSFSCVKKNAQSMGKWSELKSSRVDELIKLTEHA